MELVPKALVVGVFIPPAAPGQEQVSVERINRIWSELAPTYGFTNLQMAPDASVANFLGRSPEDGLTIQPPLIQARSTIPSSARVAADSAQSMISTVARHLAVAQVFNVGIRHVYVAPLPDNDARNYVLRRLLRSTPEDLEQLAADPDQAWGGLKYVIPLPDRQYALTLEPFLAENMRSLYIDLDAQFPGPGDIASIASRAGEAQEYIVTTVNRFLDQHALP